MFVLDDAGEGFLGRGIVHHGIALVVGRIEPLMLKSHGAPLEFTQPVVKILVDGSRKQNVRGQLLQFSALTDKVNTRTHRNILEQGIGELVVASDGYALVTVGEIVVVIDQSDGQPPDDEGRQLGAGATPLFLGILLDECLIDVTPHEGDGLLLPDSAV